MLAQQSLAIISDFEKLNSCWITMSEFITFSRNQGVIQSKMDVSIPMLTKLVSKRGKKIVMFGYYTNYHIKIAFLQDGILYRSDIV